MHNNIAAWSGNSFRTKLITFLYNNISGSQCFSKIMVFIKFSKSLVVNVNNVVGVVDVVVIAMVVTVVVGVVVAVVVAVFLPNLSPSSMPFKNNKRSDNSVKI